MVRRNWVSLVLYLLPQECEKAWADPWGRHGGLLVDGAVCYLSQHEVWKIDSWARRPVT